MTAIYVQLYTVRLCTARQRTLPISEADTLAMTLVDDDPLRIAAGFEAQCGCEAGCRRLPPLGRSLTCPHLYAALLVPILTDEYELPAGCTAVCLVVSCVMSCALVGRAMHSASALVCSDRYRDTGSYTRMIDNISNGHPMNQMVHIIFFIASHVTRLFA